MDKRTVSKILEMDHDPMIFRIAPDNAQQALLLVIFAHKALGSHEVITRRQLLDPLRAIPGLKIPRADRVLESCIGDGDVTVVSSGRVRRYALTTQGEAKANQALDGLAARS